MPLQRILDLVWMGQGACKVSQAHLQLAATQLNQVFKNSSIVQSVTERYCRVCVHITILVNSSVFAN